MNEPAAGTRSSGALRDVALVTFVATAGAVAISKIGSGPPLDEYVHVAVASLFLWTGLHFAQRDPRGVEWFGLGLGGFFGGEESEPERGLIGDLVAALPSLLRELGIALVLAALVFPPFSLAFQFWHQPTHAFVFELPENAHTYLLAQVLVVGLPEEALFRGYLQTRLQDVMPHAVRIRHVSLPWLAIVAQAVLFALVHFAVDLDPTRLSVFFPGLLFGAIRSTRGGIGAAVFFHAFCNLYSDVLVRGWL